MIKGLRIHRSDAKIIKNHMNAGNVKKALLHADKAMNGYGVESLYPDFPNFYYVNMGDTYRGTLYYTGKSFQIGDWGGYVERNSR